MTVSNLGAVIDLRLVRDDPDRVRASQRARGEDEAAVDGCSAQMTGAGRPSPGQTRCERSKRR